MSENIIKFPWRERLDPLLPAKRALADEILEKIYRAFNISLEECFEDEVEIFEKHEMLKEALIDICLPFRSAGFPHNGYAEACGMAKQRYIKEVLIERGVIKAE